MIWLTLSARQPIYCGAIVSYVIVELVMLCQPTDEDTIASKLHKLVDLLDYLVNERQVFDVQVIDQEVEIICKGNNTFRSQLLRDLTYIVDKEACPELSEGSSTLGDDLNIFQNLQTFASKLYARNLLTNLAPAALALDVYFGPTPMRRAETFLVVTDWLIRANKELHRDNEVFDAKWPEWYGIICLYTAEYGRNRDKASVRLSTSGRAAARRMEDVHPELAELHIEVLKAIEQIHANDATGYGKMSAAAKLALVQRTIKDLERVSSSKGPIAREAGTIE